MGKWILLHVWLGTINGWHTDPVHQFNSQKECENARKALLPDIGQLGTLLCEKKP